MLRNGMFWWIVLGFFFIDLVGVVSKKVISGDFEMRRKSGLGLEGVLRTATGRLATGADGYPTPFSLARVRACCFASRSLVFSVLQ